MEREINIRNKQSEAVNPLRMSVTSWVHKTIEEGGFFQEAGVRIKGEIDIFIAENKELLPGSLPIAPGIKLNTDNLSFEREVKSMQAVNAKTPGWFELVPNRAVLLHNEQDFTEEKMNEMWFTHSGLILNSLQNNLKG